MGGCAGQVDRWGSNSIKEKLKNMPAHPPNTATHNHHPSLPLPTMVGGIGGWVRQVVAMGVLVAGGGWQQLIAPVDGSSWW